MINSFILRSWLLAAALLLACTITLFAQAVQGPISYQYFYDDLGQLVKVVDSTGNVIEYVYDQVGNILEVKRSRVGGALAIFNFSPQKGGIGTTVTIQGQGFSAATAANIVKFNGVIAPVVSASSATLIVTVPAGATTGRISVTVGAATITSDGDFTIAPVPVITAVSPKLALPGEMIPGFRVSGSNLTGATFAFTPVFTPPSLTIQNVNIDQAGTSATFDLKVANLAFGTFALVATNTTGASDAFPTPSNTFKVLDPNDVFLARSASVSIRREPPTITMPIAAVSVRNGALSALLTPISAGVSVRNGAFSTTLVPFAGAVSVRNGNTSALSPFSAGVSVTKGPNISSITPSQMSRGSTVTVTISGKNLSGVTRIQFITSSGTLDESLAASSITVNAGGTSLTSTVTVNGSTALGRRFVIVSTSADHSLTVDVGSNTIEVIQ